MQSKIENFYPKLKVFMLYDELPKEAGVSLIYNKNTDVQKLVDSTEYSFPFNLRLRVFSFDLPDASFLMKKNTVQFEMKIGGYFMWKYFTDKYNFQEKDELSFYFIFGLKFQKNKEHMTYKDPLGKSVDNHAQSLYLFFSFIIQDFILKYKRIIEANGSNTELEISELNELSYLQLRDLINCFLKEDNIYGNQNLLKELFKSLDDFVTETLISTQFQEIPLFLCCLIGGVLNVNSYMWSDLKLKNTCAALCNLASLKEPNLKLLNQQNFSKLRTCFTNGLIFLININIKEGNTSWLNVVNNESIENSWQEETTNKTKSYLASKINEFIKLNGVPIKTREGFKIIREFLIKAYLNQQKNEKSYSFVINTIKNITKLAYFKEDVIDTLTELMDVLSSDFDSKIFNILIDGIKTRRWQEESEENFISVIIQIRDLLDRLEKNCDLNFMSEDLNNLILEISPDVDFILIAMKEFKYINLNLAKIKNILFKNLDCSLSEYEELLNKLSNLPQDIKQEILDKSIMEKIKIKIKRVSFPLSSEKIKAALISILLNKDVFIAGSLELVRELIKSKQPNLEDLIFITQNLIIPQKHFDLEFNEAFESIESHLMNIYPDINQLILNFNRIIKFLDNTIDHAIKSSLCDSFLSSVSQRFPQELLFKITQKFNLEENTESSDRNFDSILELSFSNKLKSIVESITMSNNQENINQFLNCICVTTTTNERVIESNNFLTDSIIYSFLDELIKVSDADKLINSLLFENPSSDSFCFKLIKGRGKHTTFSKHPYVLSLVHAITVVYNNLKNGTITVNDMIAISKQTINQKLSLLRYLENGLTEKQNNLMNINSMKQILKDEIKKILYKLNIFSQFESFLRNNFTRIKAESYEFITSYINETRQNFKIIESGKFIIIDDIMKIKDLVIDINKWTETLVFQNALKERLTKFYETSNNSIDNKIESATLIQESSTDNKFCMLGIDQFIFIAMKSIEFIESSISEIMSSDEKLEKILKIFKGLKEDDETKEFQLLEDLMRLKSKNEKKKLKMILGNLVDISKCERFSILMLKFEEMYEYSSNHTDIYKNFLDCMSHPENKFEYVSKSLVSVRHIRSKYLGQCDLENILIELSSNKDLLDFLNITPEEEIKNMVDGVDEHGDSFIRVQTIRDLLIIRSFLRIINYKSLANSTANNYTEEDLINLIVTTIKSNQAFSSIDALIDNCSKQLIHIKHLHKEMSNREEASKTKAREIRKKSLFKFNLVNEKVSKKGYDVTVVYLNGFKKISFRDLCDLRDRLLLLLSNEKEKFLACFDPNEEENKLPEKLKELLLSFIRIVSLTEEILGVLNNLHSSGFPIQFDRDLNLNDGDVSKFEEFLDNLLEMNVQWNQDLKDAYEDFYPLTYFTGNQFWELENLFCLGTSLIDSDYEATAGYNLLKYASQNFNLDKIKSLMYKNIDEFGFIYSPKKRIIMLGDVLKQIVDMQQNGSKIVKEESNVKLNFNSLKNKVIFASPSILKIYHYVLSIYFTVENTLPAANQILYCYSHTSSYELISFLYRYALCPVDRLFTLVRAENLSFELQCLLVEKLSKVMKHDSNQLLAKLCIICCDKNSFIHNQFHENNTYIYNLRNFEIMDETILMKILTKLNLNAFVIRSNDTGAGKTHRIQKQFGYDRNSLNEAYANFPILDSVNIEAISERLYNFNTRKNEMIHITIGGIIDNYEMIDYLLFEYIFIGCFKHESKVSFRKKDDKIFIEVWNTYYDTLYNSLRIFPLIPQNETINSTDNLKNIDICSNTTPEYNPIEIVCNFLFHYNSDTINTVDIHPSKTWRKFNKDECLSLLNKYFIKNNKSITFRQVWIFINVLATQLTMFSNNNYFTCENIEFIRDISLFNIRKSIMESLLLMTEEFTTRSIIAARQSQERTSNFIKISYQSNVINSNLKNEDLLEEEKRLIELESLSSVLNWSKSNHLLIMFHEDGMCLTPVYRTLDHIPESVKHLVESQGGNLEDFQTMSQKDLLIKLHNIVGKYYQENKFRLDNYVVTADNFLKMLLIIIRVRANVPIVVMGETGCGKTSLIKFLTTTVLEEGFEVINFHAGIKEFHIIERMKDIIVKATTEYFITRLWVFFDEINTCDCLGLITEIICQKTMMGQILPENLVFISACNPYKIRKNIDEVGLIKQRISTKLVYRVHPLPDSIIDYVWDYGSLSEIEEKLYITNMLSSLSGEMKNISIDLVIKSQVFIKNCSDKFSVSLRDVCRFKTLHEWFFNMLNKKNQLATLKKQEQTSEYYYIFNFSRNKNRNNHNSFKYNDKASISRKALVLALMVNYYNRCGTITDRSEYKKIIINKLGINVDNLDDMIKEEQMDIVGRMELPTAIALNTAILENIFTLLVCVINKIPLFICGKPGCSKSLSIQLLLSNLRGQDSTDPFFKTLPRILGIPYQGSESSTSEGIERSFEKAENINRDDCGDINQILPLIIFEEIGLAEISKNNPLKVLHSLLEPEKPKLAFVGISNWRLDASKMNRAIYLARPDPDLPDLENTALAIFEYYIKEPRYDERLIMKALARTYFDFKNQQALLDYPDFHSTRDFYSLIKQVTFQIITHYTNYNEMKFKIVKDALCRNFGGLNNSINTILHIFAKHMHLDIDFCDIEKSMMNLITENLEEMDARYLLLFTTGSSASYILDNYLKTVLKERTFLIGSEFEEDKNKEEHSFRTLSDIIQYMESGSSIIMKNLDQMYGALYDLFNQNFMIVGNKKNCRIALGSTNNPMCFVHQNFHSVVLVDIKDKDKMDPPFLNRFEKQILNFDSILTIRQKNLVSALNRWITSITDIKSLNQEITVNIHDLIVSYNSEDFSQSVILLHYVDDKTNEEIMKEAKKSVLSLANIKFILYSILSKTGQIYKEELNQVQNIYFEEQYHDSLVQYLKNSEDNSRQIVYTHSNILDEFNFNHTTEQGMEIDSNNNFESYLTLNIAEIRAEKEFDKRFILFLKSEYKWLFIKIDCETEKKHISIIKFKIDKIMNDWKIYLNQNNILKNVVIIIYLGRNAVASNKFENTMESQFLSGWNQIMIDNLNGGEIQGLKELLNYSTLEIVEKFTEQSTITDIIYNIILRFDYETYNSESMENIRTHIPDILYKVDDRADSELYQIIKEKAIELIKTKHDKIVDWKLKVCGDIKIISKSLNTLQAIKLVIAELLEFPLLKIMHSIVKESAINSFFLARMEKHTENTSSYLQNKRKLWI